MRNPHRIIDGYDCKQCSKCHKWLPVSMYSKDNSKWDGLHGYCKECTSAKDRKYYEKSSRKYAPYNPEYYKSEKSKQKKSERDAKRRYMMRNANAQHKITPEIIDYIVSKYGGKCVYCGVSCEKKFHIDHKVPLSLGGGNDIDNLALSCPKCNFKKRTKTDVQYCGHHV